jgi:hypothetical protein
MAAIYFSAATAAVSLSAATAKTVLQIVAPSNQRVRVNKFSVSFNGTSATAEPVYVRILKQTTAGTMTSLTPRALVPLVSGEAINTTAQHTATVEPSASDVLRTLHVHPQGGHTEILHPLPIVLLESERLGIECTAPGNVSVIANLECEE